MLRRWKVESSFFFCMVVAIAFSIFSPPVFAVNPYHPPGYSANKSDAYNLAISQCYTGTSGQGWEGVRSFYYVGLGVTIHPVPPANMLLAFPGGAVCGGVNYDAAMFDYIVPVYYIKAPPLKASPKLGNGPVKGNSQEGKNSFVAEPINVTTGNNVHTESVTIGAGARAIHFDRVYNSQANSSGRFGANWSDSFSSTIQPVTENKTIIPPPPLPDPTVSSNYDTPSSACSDGWNEIRGSITQAWAASSAAHITTDGASCEISYNNGQAIYGKIPIYSSPDNRLYYPAPPTGLEITRSDGGSVVITGNGSDWVDDKGITYRMEQLTDGTGNVTGWRYTTNEKTIESYDASGQLISVEAPDGVTQTLAYDAGLLQSVTNDVGYSLTFTYDSQNRVTAMTDHTGRVWSYAYDQNNNLISVGQPDSTTRQYHYDNGSFPNALTGVTDERGIQYLTYTYDGKGRVASFNMPGNAARQDFSYDDNNLTRAVTNGEGVTTNYTVTLQNDTPLITQVNGPGCDTCRNGSVVASFDGQTNNLTSLTQDGITTKYGNYDGQGNPGYKITRPRHGPCRNDLIHLRFTISRQGEFQDRDFRGHRPGEGHPV